MISKLGKDKEKSKTDTLIYIKHGSIVLKFDIFYVQKIAECILSCFSIPTALFTVLAPSCGLGIDALSTNVLLKDFSMFKIHAARLLTGTRKQKHITPVLKELHWLPVTVRICFKILLMAFKCLNLLAPRYLTDRLTVYKPLRSLRSSTKHLLVQPCCNLKTYGERVFSVASPRLWNVLPLNIRNCKTITTFKSALKTHLFKSYFEP